LDSDDRWDPRKLEKQVNGLSETDIASFTGYFVENNNWQYLPPHDMSLIHLQKGNALGPTSTALIKRSALKDVGGFDESLASCQDWELWLRLYAKGPVALVREPLVRFEERGSDRISKDIKGIVEGHTIVFRRVTEAARSHDFPTRRRIHAMHHARLATAILGDFRKPYHALYYSALSLLAWPNRYALRLSSRCAALALRDLISAPR
jgi:GT2 family glycosyltransferase